MSWNFADPASRKNIDRTWRKESDSFLELISERRIWDSPTAAGHWKVSHVVAHAVDLTNVYLEAFQAARKNDSTSDPLGVRAMASMMDQGAQKVLRESSREEIINRLGEDLLRMREVVDGITDDEWATLMVPHKFMGPVPAGFFPICQVLDYAVHGWDIRQGLGQVHILDGDVADLLAPLCFTLWQATCEPDGGEPFDIGIRITSGRNAGDTRITVNDKGLDFHQESIEGLSETIEFDPASFVLTAFGRINGGTARGDIRKVNRFLRMFFRV